MEKWWLTMISESKNNDAFEDSVYAMNELIRPYLRAFFTQQ